MSNTKSAGAVDVTVGERVKMQRLICQMSQTDLANAIGVSFQQVQKYERGTNRIGAGRLHHIAIALNVPVTFFFDGVAPTTKKASKLDLAGSPDIVGKFFSLPYALELAQVYIGIVGNIERRAIVDIAHAVARTKAGPRRAKAA